MLPHLRKLSSMKSLPWHNYFFLKRIMNRTQILSLILLILITAIPQNLFAEVVTQSFDGNRQAVMPGVLLTRLVNTVAIN